MESRELFVLKLGLGSVFGVAAGRVLDVRLPSVGRSGAGIIQKVDRHGWLLRVLAFRIATQGPDFISKSWGPLSLVRLFEASLGNQSIPMLCATFAHFRVPEFL